MGQSSSWFGPEMIGNWRVMDGSSFEGTWKVIGGGGGGQVFEVKHHQWKKNVAVKILGVDNGLHPKEDLFNEANLMLSAKGPYIAKVLGVFRGRTPHCPAHISVGLVMDVMESGCLYSLQKKREYQPLPWPLVFRLAYQVAAGMECLHILTPDALIHKDLKPQNILLDSDLNVKIADFGISRLANSVTDVSVKGEKTCFFAPPEAFLTPAPPSTCAYDVIVGTENDTFPVSFSVYAVLMWTILNPVYNDAFPFDVSNGVTSLQKVKRIKVPGLDELVELMVKYWNKDPERRPTFADCTAVTQRLYDMNKSGIDVCVLQMKDFQRLTLDTNTTHRYLSLSENNRKVARDGQDRSYPDHDDRFDGCPQVLCTESLTGRCYWEVEWSGWVAIAVTYRGISRKGRGDDCDLGENDKSWSLLCYNSYSVRHNREQTFLPVSPSSDSNRVDRFGRPVDSGRVAVYVDHPAGTLSFYDVSSDTLTHLYTYQTTFTEPLYTGFRVSSGSVRLV